MTTKTQQEKCPQCSDTEYQHRIPYWKNKWATDMKCGVCDYCYVSNGAKERRSAMMDYLKHHSEQQKNQQ